MKERAFQRKCAKRISKIAALLLAVAMIAANFIGVPVKAFASEESIITEVSADIPFEAVAGYVPSHIATGNVAVGDSSKYEATAGWLDAETDELVNGFEFIEGHSYKLILFFYAKDGYTFAPDCTAAINGAEAVNTYNIGSEVDFYVRVTVGASVHNITWGTGENDMILSWDPVEGAAKYAVEVAGSRTSGVYSTFYNCTSFINRTGTFAPIITAYGADGDVLAKAIGPEKFFEVPQLATPSNIKVENNVITWNPVPNATEYRVTLYERKEDCRIQINWEEIKTNRITFRALSGFLTEGNTYFVEIRAKNRNGGYADSELGVSSDVIYTGDVLLPITNITWGTGANDRVLYWNPVEGAAKYAVDVAGTRFGGITSTSYDCSSVIRKTGTFAPTIVAYDTYGDVIAETVGPEKYFEVPKLATPRNIKAEGGVITWDEVANVREYEVRIYECINDSLKTAIYRYIGTNSAKLGIFAHEMKEGKTYCVAVTAVNSAGGYADSEAGFSEKFVYEIFYDVNTSVVGEGGTISDGATVKNHDSYEVTLTPMRGRVISYLKINGIDVTAAIVGNKYTITNITEEKNVEVSFSTCNHNWGSGTVTTAATCKAAGARSYTCSVCGETKTETIPKLTEHTWNTGEVVTEPNCGRTGLMKYTCKVCGAVREEMLAKTETHTYGDFVVTLEATCANTGIKAKTCTVCGHKIEESIPVKSHKEVTVKGKAATCTAEGLTDGKKCSVCGTVTVAQRKINALGHSFSGGVTQAKCDRCSFTREALKDVENLTVATGVKEAKLTWSAVPGAVKYAVYMKSSAGTTLLNSNVTTNSYKATGLAGGEKVGFTVRPYKDGWGNYSPVVWAMVHTPQTAVASKVVVATDMNQATVSWSEVSGANAYALYQKNADGSTSLISNRITGTTYTVTGLADGARVGYCVRAKIDSDWYGYSSVTWVTLPAPAVPPTGVKAQGGDGCATVTWNEVPGAARYALYQKSASGAVTLISAEVTGTSYEVTGLTNGEAVGFVLKSRTSKGWSTWSATGWTKPQSGR